MTKHCPEDGEMLTPVGDFREHWCDIYRSSAGAYIQVVDDRSEYPLIRLQRGVLEKLDSAPPQLLDLAFRRIRRIDYRTVSVLAFEHTLLGCYRPEAAYRVVYPDGSEC